VVIAAPEKLESGTLLLVPVVLNLALVENGIIDNGSLYALSRHCVLFD
jgi:hypothetical protein